MPDINKLWPMGTIPYVLDGDQCKSLNNLFLLINIFCIDLIVNLKVSEKSKIMLAMNEYHENTCIRFVERTNEYDYIHIAKQNGY